MKMHFLVWRGGEGFTPSVVLFDCHMNRPLSVRLLLPFNGDIVMMSVMCLFPFELHGRLSARIRKRIFVERWCCWRFLLEIPVRDSRWRSPKLRYRIVHGS